MTTVPDGDPCPRHGQPTRLIVVPGLGLYSQCRGCQDAFLAWYRTAGDRERAAGADENPPTADEVEKQEVQMSRGAQIGLAFT